MPFHMLPMLYFVLQVAVLPSIAGDDAKSDAAQTPAGHSEHGEAFNEGPRQKAFLMPDTGNIHFPVTSKNEQVQKFIEQGIGQLHGFWYFEAERSFRQASAFDPECAIAYWGMAMANTNNSKRAKGFIAEAVQRKKEASKREAMYIDALDNYYKAKRGGSSRAQSYTSALESIVLEYPDDIEAKAFLGLQLWLNRSDGLQITSYMAADALIGQVLDVEPLHPCHHYRIHLWDSKKPTMALESAALCGQSAPGIAHMWHMPGHIYSKLKRYDDAAWQQEASARVDHAHMMHDQVLPDQIHNFAHNNEWLIRNLINLGRVSDATDLARNMVELPQHPNYNTLNSRGSAYYGRTRLFEVLSRFELWDDLLNYCDTPYLGPTDKFEEQIKRLRYMGRACFRSNRIDRGNELIRQLEGILADKETARETAGETAIKKANEEKKPKKEMDKASDNARREFTSDINLVEKALHELRGHRALLDGKPSDALALFNKARGMDDEFLIQVESAAGKKDDALESARNNVKSHKGEVVPLATLIETLWATDNRDEAKKELEGLRGLARHADLDNPVMARISSIASELGVKGDWRNTTLATAKDTGIRPELDSLGPFRWQPSAAPTWTLTDANGSKRSLAEYSGKPVVVIFYLGYGCLHCAEQLQSFAPKTKEFEKAGISLLAISTDSQAKLTESHKLYKDGSFPFPLLSNSELDLFRKYRVFDDFEETPMHGTFLIDGNGMIRWHDISYEPFNNPDFLLRKPNRLLAQPMTKQAARQ